MNEKRLSELLNKEINLKVSEKVPQRVLDTPIRKVEKKTTFKIVPKKKIAAIVSLVACVLVLVIAATIFLPPLFKNEVQNEYTCYVVDINPSVLVNVDKNGNVISVSAINDDANLVVMDDSVKNSKNLKECMQNIINTCTKLGFIDASSNQNAVKISALAQNGALSKKQAENASLIVEEYLKANGIFSVVLSENLTKEVLQEKINVDINNSNVLDALKDLKTFTYEKEEITKQFEEYKATMIRAILQDIKDSLIFINNNKDDATKKEEVDAKIDHLKIYGLYVNDSSIALYLMAFNSLNIEEISSLEDISNSQLGYLAQYADIIFSSIDDKDSFVEKVVKSFKDKYAERLIEYKEIFENKREAISSKEYQEYLDNIIKQYGSIEAYYENVLKK